MVDVFIDGKLVGTIKDSQDFIKQTIQARRAGKISRNLNIRSDEKGDAVHIVLGKDRIIRPLIVVKDGKPLITEEHIKKLQAGEIKWQDFIKQGIIENIDALEEDNALVALTEKELTKEHTHLEINPLSIFSINSSMIPYPNFNQSSRFLQGQKVHKQGIGMYSTNFLNRMETNVSVLHYPQRPIVNSITQKTFGEGLSGGQNIIIAILNYDGYNLEDAVVVNKASLEHGFARSTYYRPYGTEKLRYPGGQVDEICVPDKDVQGYTLEEDYRLLDDDGLIFPETEVNASDVLIGKSSPPRFLSKLETFSTAANIRKDTSVRVKHGAKGVVSKVFITESKDGNLLIRTEVRESRQPEIGDKFASRHGQKGVIGMIVPPEDIPFTAGGVRPDIIFSPFGMRRMTVSHILEALSGKVGALGGRYVDATAFQSEHPDDLRNELKKLGFREDGTETLYDGKTGKELKARIFIGNIFYMRLKHQVADKLQSRGRGRVALLTRQPTAGKAMEGGLRFGEMEKEAVVGHGASLLMKERFDSDRTVLYVCERCGDIAVIDAFKNKTNCLMCGEGVKASPIEMSYAFKLFLDEIKSMGIRPKLLLKDKF